jgi:hypothetical protein
MPRPPIDPKVLELLKTMTTNDPDPGLLAEKSQDTCQDLRALFERFFNGKEKELRPGMLAVWKMGLKNRRFPVYGEPAIVMEVLDAPTSEEQDESGLPYFREPLDLLLGMLREGIFFVYHFDRRRFEPYRGRD